MNKKIIYISVLIAVIFISAFTGIIVYYNGVINNKDSQIALLNTQNTNLNNQIANLNSQIANLNSQINSLNSQVANLNGQLTSQNVKVSGSISEIDPEAIHFTSTTTSVTTTTWITGNTYSVILSSGQSYSVDIHYNGNGYGQDDYATLYIPYGVTTFTANF